MKTTEIRQKLFDYIRVADEKKVRAIYTMVESEIQEDADLWTDEFLDEMNKRASEFESGKVKGYSWEEVKARARQFAKNKHT